MGRRAQRRRQPPAPTPVSAAPLVSLPAPPDEVSLDRLADLVSARDLIDLEVAHLVDALATDGVGWPAIAAVLGVTRQAARQAHHRRTRHRDRRAGRTDPAGSSPAAGP